MSKEHTVGAVKILYSSAKS